MLKCPHCGNTNTRFFESNGSTTLLCVAPVDLGDDSFGGDADPPLVPNAEGKVTCGMQWEGTRRQAAFLRGR